MNRIVVHILPMVALLLPAGVLLDARSVAQSSAAVPGAGAELLQQSDVWVPFSAQLEKTTGGGKRFAGRYYQGSDGSTRYETGPGPVLTEVTAAGIRNIIQGSDWQ